MGGKGDVNSLPGWTNTKGVRINQKGTEIHEVKDGED